MRATIAPKLAKKLRLVKRKPSNPVTVASGTTNIAQPGEATATLKFTPKAKKRLKRARAVPLKLAGTFAGSPVTGGLKLTR